MRKKAIKDILIILKPTAGSDFNVLLPNLVRWLSRRKKNIYFIKSEESKINALLKNTTFPIKFIDKEDVNNCSQLIISLGGDGTLLGICRLAKKNTPPILGVNMGRLGFITQFSRHKYIDELLDIINGKFETNKVHLYQIEISNRGKKRFKSFFFNDAVINSAGISRMLSASVETSEEHIYNLSGDGIIISSPIGSTAYSLAAGGPLVHPQVKAMAITPICPHSLNYRPLVVPDQLTINIRVSLKNTHANLTLDGQEAVEIKSNDIIKISKSKSRYVNLVSNPEKTYFQTLKEKFTLGKRSI